MYPRRTPTAPRRGAHHARSRCRTPSCGPVAVRPRPREPLVRSRCRAHNACPVVRSRCGRARCPHRAAAPSARCAAWQVAHAESFACRGSVRGTVRGRAAHPARCHDRAAITTQNSHAHYPGGAMVGRRASRLAPYRHYTRHYTREIRPRITHAHYSAARWSAATARGGAPPTLTALCRGTADSGQSTPSETLRFSPAGFPKGVSLGEHATIWPCNRDNRWPSHAWL